LKGILNRAFQNGLVADNSARRKVKPLAKVDEARIRRKASHVGRIRSPTQQISFVATGRSTRSIDDCAR